MKKESMADQISNFLSNLPYIHLLYSSPDLPIPSERSIIEQITGVEPLGEQNFTITWEKQTPHGHLGTIRMGDHVVRLAGLDQPLPAEVIHRTVHASQWLPQLKAGMRQHQSHLSLVYTGGVLDPVEKMVALYKTARAFSHENLLGIVNENAWTAHPPADSLSPQKIISYRQEMPFKLWIGYVKFFLDENRYWLVTKGHHIFDVPDLAYLVQPGDDPESVIRSFINIFYYIYEQDVVVTAGDTLSIKGTGETMRFSEVKEFEDFLMGPSGTLVVEKISPDEEISA
jgi:hypothetical protein